MAPRHLILGSSGFVGYHLAQYLLERGCEVAGVDLSETLIQAEGYTHVVGDASDETLLRETLRPGDVVVDVASSIKPKDARRSKRGFLETVIKGGLALSSACHAKKVAKLVYVSTAGEMYGNVESPAGEDSEYPITAYAYGKLTAELLLRQRFPTVVARVSNPFGNRRSREHGFVDVAINRALAGERVEIWGSDRIVRDYLHIQDVSAAIAILAASDCRHPCYNVCSGTYHSLGDIVALIDAHLKGRTVESVVVEAAVQDVTASRPDPRRIQAEFGWRPTLSLEGYVKQRLAE